MEPVASHWRYAPALGTPVQVAATVDLWGQPTALAWLSDQDAAMRIAVSDLRPISEAPLLSPDRMAYIASAARVADALERDALVAPLESPVIPLPHQIHALSRAMAGNGVRYLLADEVGLGKTVEAGLILRELKLRGLVQRVLVVAPTGLVAQWVGEMRAHFNEDFRPVIPGDFAAWRKLAGVDDQHNLWRLHDQVVCPLDAVKPMDARRGWNAERVACHNRERFEDLVAAGWDLVIIDEAHRLGGSTDRVARHRLGEALSQAAPCVLLLSATPHQGKTDNFCRLLGLLDSETFSDEDSVRRERVAPFVIRAEKRNAVDAEGAPLFKPRRTQLVPVAWTTAHRDQRALYDAVTEYVREGYDQARLEKNAAIGFLMILMQRLVTSSVRAIRTALERRLEVLDLPADQASLFSEDVRERWADLDAQEQLQEGLGRRVEGFGKERAEVEALCSAARRCEAKGPDAKAQALLDQVRALQQEENDYELKILIFTEFIPTQAMLAEFLADRGFSVAQLNGSLDMDERREVQRAFATEAQVLISTDAGGEGLNLQFCHVVINYDLPWNPMKLEQRIGRVDRIGQNHVVRALNFALEDTVELRVREVLQDKLARILAEFGVDKLADVLDSEEGGLDFDELYVNAVLEPESAEARANELAERVRARAAATREGLSVLGSPAEPDASVAWKIAHHRVPYWTERMALAYLRSEKGKGAQAEPDEVGYRLRWPDGNAQERVVFARSEARQPGVTLLTLENPQIRALTTALCPFAPGQSLAAIVLNGISDKVAGIWSLWRIALGGRSDGPLRMLPLFISDEGRTLVPTALAVWDRLIDLDGSADIVRGGTVSGAAAATAYEQSRQEAESQGHALYSDLADMHARRQEWQRRARLRASGSRRAVVERLALPEVRERRLRELEEDEAQLRERLADQDQVLPDLSALLMVRIARDDEQARRAQ